MIAKTRRADTPPSDRAAATKAAILAAARKAFAAHGYDGAGLRGIAEGAGVTAMMVGRYFGSKEQLFAEVVAASMADPIILRSENLGAAELGRAFAEALVGLTGPNQEPLDGFLILFRSVSSPVAARIARKQIAAIHLKTASSAVRGGVNTAERAALFLALVAGVQMMRQMIGLAALTSAAPETLVNLLAPLIDALMNGSGRARHRADRAAQK